MTQMLERPLTSSYAPPALEPLGTLRSLTKGAGPSGELVMMITNPFAPLIDGDGEAMAGRDGR